MNKWNDEIAFLFFLLCYEWIQVESKAFQLKNHQIYINAPLFLFFWLHQLHLQIEEQLNERSVAENEIRFAVPKSMSLYCVEWSLLLMQ